MTPRRPEVERLRLDGALARILSDAEDVARRLGVAPHSGHVLLCFFAHRHPARRLLEELGIDDDRLLAQADRARTEPKSVMRGLLERAAGVAASCGAESVGPLHLLVAVSRNRDAVAHEWLVATGKRMSTVRARVLTVLTSPAPRWVERPSVRRSLHEAQSEISRPSTRPRTSTTTIAPPSSPAAAPAEPPTAPGPTPTASPTPAGPALDPKRFPWLTSLGRNLSAEAAAGLLDPLVGRGREVEQVMDILGKRRANNPCLVGEPGVGKTAVVEGLALQAVGRRDWIIVSLDVGALLVGTHLRGSFSEKLRGLKEEVAQSEGRIIVFLDELHTLVGAGSTGDGPLDAANELKAVLARGEFPCIGATTGDEYRRHIDADPALSRRFTPVRVDEPTPGRTLDMLYRIAPAYAEHHGIGYTKESLHAAVRLSVRYITDRRLPDKAIGLIDLAGSRAARSGREEVDTTLVTELVAERLDVPVERIMPDPHLLLELEQRLQQRVVGHAEHLRTIADAVRRNAAGFQGDQPQGVFLFLGPTGVGKTETAKALAAVLYGPGDNLIRFDFNDFSEPHAVARLIGAPPGYVGHEGGGQLTEAIARRPGRVVLIDEVEKAHPEVLSVLLTLLDEGRLTDARGRSFSFSESIIIMTSNAGSDGGAALGFDRSDAGRARLESAQAYFAPELWGRIPDKLVFEPLTRRDLTQVLQRLLHRSSTRLQRERGISFEVDGAATRFLLDQADLGHGARPLRQVVQSMLEGPIARRILEGRLHADEHVVVTTREAGGLRFEVEGTSLSRRPGP
jgi:ATP-dependent Clp protease ATP-binding subunit ClpC